MADLKENNNLESLVRDAQRKHSRGRVATIVVIVIIVLTALIAFFVTNQLGRLEVQILPDAAAVNAKVTIADGQGFYFKTNIWALNKEVSLLVESAGYVSEELIVPDAAWDRGKIEVILQVKLAEIRATSLPELDDTNWYLNDVLIARGARVNQKVDPGTYEMSARNPFYKSLTRTVDAEPGEQLELEFDLIPIERDLTITSEPELASVTIDSIKVGQTPLKMKVQGGDLEIQVALDGYKPQTQKITVTTESNSIKRHYELQRQSRPISFQFKPKGGEISLDGLNSPELANSSINLNLDSEHRVRYSKPGYAASGLNFTVSSELVTPIVLELTPIMGIVDIRSDPVADVEVDGKTVGQTPLRLSLLTTEQQIKLTSPGYLQKTITILPDEAAPQAVTVVLTSEKEHRLATAFETYKNSIGMEFKLFMESDKFMMGSNPGEAGRRSNEFVRDIQFERPFYAGIYEVSIEQYSKFSPTSNADSNSRFPVTGIDWTSAAMFCNWLSEKEGFEPVYLFTGNQFLGSKASADGYRMLTEPEWEWLARKAGKLRASEFTWGDSTTIPKNSGNLADETAQGSVNKYIANYEDGHVKLAPIGSFAPNAAGIHDLSGNAREWTHDSYSLRIPSKNITEIDSFDESAEGRRTIKGSNWSSARLTNLRAAWRDGSISPSDDLGFRIGRYLYKEISSE